MQTVQDVWGLTLTFSYDAEGNRTGVQDSLGGQQTSTFDAANRLLSRTFSASGLPALRIEQNYDEAGRLTSQLRYHDAGQSPSRVTDSEYSYDAAGHITDLEHTDSWGNTLAGYHYSYDAAGQLTSTTENGTTRNYSYDDAGQLTADGTGTYSYDGAGNRTMTGYTTGDGNQLTSDGTWNYSYDAEGNETKKVNIQTGQTWTYGYDQRNQLTWAEERATDGGTLELRADYTYDVFGNRIEKQVDQDGDGTVDLTQRYAYDGFNPARGGAIGNEHWDVWAELDGNGSLTTRYLRGDVVDELFARIESDGDAYWLLGDSLGSVRDVIDNSGALKDRITYDGYGNIISETDPVYGGRYKYTGREFDAEIGLQYNHARYYDASTGRWTTQDPLGFAAGDSNLYRYVNNQPTTSGDPSGMDPPLTFGGIPTTKPTIAYDPEKKLFVRWNPATDERIVVDQKLAVEYVLNQLQLRRQAEFAKVNHPTMKEAASLQRYTEDGVAKWQSWVNGIRRNKATGEYWGAAYVQPKMPAGAEMPSHGALSYTPVIGDLLVADDLRDVAPDIAIFHQFMAVTDLAGLPSLMKALGTGGLKLGAKTLSAGRGLLRRGGTEAAESVLQGCGRRAAQSLDELAPAIGRGQLPHMSHWRPPTPGSLMDNVTTAHHLDLIDRFDGVIRWVDDAPVHPGTGRRIYGTYDPGSNTITFYRDADWTTSFHELLHWEDIMNRMQRFGVTRQQIQQIQQRGGAMWATFWQNAEQAAHRQMLNFGFTPKQP